MAHVLKCSHLNKPWCPATCPGPAEGPSGLGGVRRGGRQIGFGAPPSVAAADRGSRWSRTFNMKWNWLEMARRLAEGTRAKLAGDLSKSLAKAPVEEDDLNEETAAALDRARASLARGEGVPHEEILREFGQ